jgi:hypothetical protein
LSKTVRTVEACVAALPKTIKIGPYDWSVTLMEGKEGELCGQADFAVQHLRLWPENLTSPNHVVGIFLHECLHVIFGNHGLDKMKRDKEEREEAIVAGFESGLVSLFRDNPKLMNWMTKGLR